MHTKYYFYHSLLISLLIVIAGGVWWHSATQADSGQRIADRGRTDQVGVVKTDQQVHTSDTPKHTTNETESNTVSGATATATTTYSDTQSLLTLIIGTTTYQIPSHDNETLIDAMRRLTSQNDHFTFAGQEYSGLGFFVTSINGLSAHNGYNWMLYVNGKESDVGASHIRINHYSTIEWKYEN